MQKEHIEREALMFDIAAKFEKHYGKCREQSIHDFYKFVIKKMCAVPAADVVEVRHGRWEDAEDDYFGLHIIKCSECREEWCFEVDDDVKDLNYNYCPHCGALMDKEE